ncbi:hypothetical protein HZS_2415 [Henneguya salminicola]|nr:hypothetical protein HZS_2415 [Henneguya salminicola]
MEFSNNSIIEYKDNYLNMDKAETSSPKFNVLNSEYSSINNFIRHNKQENEEEIGCNPMGYSSINYPVNCQSKFPIVSNIYEQVPSLPYSYYTNTFQTYSPLKAFTVNNITGVSSAANNINSPSMIPNFGSNPNEYFVAETYPRNYSTMNPYFSKSYNGSYNKIN